MTALWKKRMPVLLATIQMYKIQNSRNFNS